MSEQHDETTQPLHHHHKCGNLFGCGDENGTGVLREDIKDAAFQKRSADRLLHMDEVDQERLDAYVTARGRSRRNLMRASGFIGLLAAVEPWFAKLALAADAPTAPATGSKRTSATQQRIAEYSPMRFADKSGKTPESCTWIGPVAWPPSSSK